jgi:hypothetical protein
MAGEPGIGLSCRRGERQQKERCTSVRFHDPTPKGDAITAHQIATHRGEKAALLRRWGAT